MGEMSDARSSDGKDAGDQIGAGAGDFCRPPKEHPVIPRPRRALGRWYGRWGKRTLELSLSLLALLLFSPLILALAGLVRIALGRPVFFRQERPGLHGSLFALYKFRTMTHYRDGRGKLLTDAQRLTPLGRVLRSTSLDELPELWNVLRGDMSLVGPRPLLTQYLGRYTPEQARRHDVKPGITGWAQVNGRNALTWDEKFRLDVWYVDHVSCWLDMRIIALTLWKILLREGISSPGQATMHEFLGSDLGTKDSLRNPR